MKNLDRMTIYQTILQTGMVPLFFHTQVDIAIQVTTACMDGGARVVEFTNRGEGALQVFAQLVEYFRSAKSELILGIGSILDAPTAALFIAHGASFIVGPTFNPEVSQLCNRRKIAYIPGCATPTEISTAEAAGAEIVKIFPPSPDLIKSVLGPMPWSHLMPSGGVEVNRSSVEKWIKAGAAAVSVGSQLISKQSLADRNFESIRTGTASMLQWIQEIRKE
jgi:2-dehydro-3-deoxyphosphogluconate aldolase/(4S)-4-hydroxy-2-oxoglutarate aldolase